MKHLTPQDIADHIVEKLAQKRQKLAISYEKLAEKTGLHRTAISLIERKKRQPSLLNILKLADALEIDLSDLITEVKNRTKR